MHRLLLRVTFVVAVVASGACAKSSGAAASGPATASDFQLGEDVNRLLDELTLLPIAEEGGEAGVYRIAAGDLLEITVFEAPELSRSVRVSHEGDISLPLLGVIRAGGSTPRELAASLEEQLRQSYMLDPHVSVHAAEIQRLPIYVLGEVNRPGSFPLAGRESVTVLQAVALGQGLRPAAAPERAVIIRRMENGERAGIAVDIGRVIAGQAIDPTLQPNDIVFVPHSATKSVAQGLGQVLLRLVTWRIFF